MKKILSLLSVLFAVFSCIGEEKGAAEADPSKEELVSLRVSVPRADTRSMTASDDDSVENVQLFVFDENDELEAYESGYMRETVFRCAPGSKKVVAIVNGPDFSQVRLYHEVAESISDLIDDNKPGRLVMSGEKAVQVSGEEGSLDVPVQVCRLCAKIILSSLTLDFDVPYYRNMDFAVTGVYLLNVSGSCTYSGERSDDVWYNMMEADKETGPELIGDLLPAPVSVAQGEQYPFRHELYCYPNDHADTSSPVWRPRSTRLVVEALVGNDRFFYPVTLNKVERNAVYKVHLTLRRPGSQSPDDPVEVYWGKGIVEVAPWDVMDEIVEEI